MSECMDCGKADIAWTSDTGRPYCWDCGDQEVHQPASTEAVSLMDWSALQSLAADLDVAPADGDRDDYEAAVIDELELVPIDNQREFVDDGNPDGLDTLTERGALDTPDRSQTCDCGRELVDYGNGLHCPDCSADETEGTTLADYGAPGQTTLGGIDR